MFCKNCGREQKIGQKFCPICGTQFAAVVNKEQEDEADTCQCLPKTASVDDEAKKLMSEENTIEEKKSNNLRFCGTKGQDDHRAFGTDSRMCAIDHYRPQCLPYSWQA